MTDARRRAVALVAERELTQQLRGKALWISTALTLLGVVLIVVLPTVIRSGKDSYRVAVQGSAPAALTALLERSAAEAGVDIGVVPAGTGDPDALLQGKDAVDVVIVTQPISIVLDHRPQSSSSLRTLVSALARNLAAAQAMQHAQLTPSQQQALLEPAPVPVRDLRAPPSSDAGRAVAIAGSVLFFFLAMRYGIGLLVSIAQEKGSRVVEIVLSCVRPVDLLAGKIIASVAVVTAQAVLVAAAALIAASAVGSDILAGGGAGQIVVEAIWIILGFMIYAALFTAAGSLAGKPEDAQSLGLPIQLLLFVGYFASTSGIGGNVSPFLRVLAYVPFTAPMDMPLLWTLGAASTLDLVISMLITVVTIALVTRFAAAVFRASVLRTGQRVRLRPLLRELRGARSA